jgi:hypothetical protein
VWTFDRQTAEMPFHHFLTSKINPNSPTLIDSRLSHPGSPRLQRVHAFLRTTSKKLLAQLRLEVHTDRHCQDSAVRQTWQCPVHVHKRCREPMISMYGLQPWLLESVKASLKPWITRAHGRGCSSEYHYTKTDAILQAVRKRKEAQIVRLLKVCTAP